MCGNAPGRPADAARLPGATPGAVEVPATGGGIVPWIVQPHLRRSRATRRTSAYRFHPRVQDAGPAQEAAVHPRDRRAVPSRQIVPVPGVSCTAVQKCLEDARRTPGVLGLANLFSGGALLQLSIFALGIMPYITASIIVQLLTVVIPRFEALKKEGQQGQSRDDARHNPLPDHRSGRAAVLHADHLRPEPAEPLRRHLHEHPGGRSIPTLVDHGADHDSGTGLVMWLGELVTDKGIGNGMSLLIFTSIAATFPSSPVGDPAAGGPLGHLPRRHPARLPHHRARRLRRAEPAPHPGASTPSAGGPPDVRRHLHLHSAEGQHGRRHPGHLRLVAARAPDPGRAVQRSTTGDQPG